MITIKEAFDKANAREAQYLDAILNKPNHNIFRIASTLRADNVSKFLYFLFEENDIEKAKQSIYLGQKLLEFMNKCEKNKYFPTQLNKLFFLCSDSREVIDNFKKFDIETIPNLEYRIEQGHTLGFVAQQILKCNNQKALYYLDIYRTKYRPHTLKIYDIEILEAIINEDKTKIQELLKIYLLPKNHNKSSEKGMLSHGLLSYEATVFAKLAWLKGIEVNVNHKLLPKELLPVQPNENYIIEYDFLKPDFKQEQTSVSEQKKRVGFLDRLFKKN